MPGNSGEKKHWHEDDADAKRGNEGGQSDFLRTIQNGLLKRFASGHLAVNVLNFHGSVVHEDTYSQCQSAEGHEVDRFAQSAEHGDGTQDGKRDGERNDDRAAPGGEEQQNHHGGEGSGNNTLFEHAINGCAHKERLIGKLLHFELGRETRQDARHYCFDPSDHIERGGRAAFQDSEQSASDAVLSHHVLLRLEAIAHLRHIPHVKSGAIESLNRKIVELIEHAGACVQLDVILSGTNFGGAAREDQILGIDRVDDVLG